MYVIPTHQSHGSSAHRCDHLPLLKASHSLFSSYIMVSAHPGITVVAHCVPELFLHFKYISPDSSLPRSSSRGCPASYAAVVFSFMSPKYGEDCSSYNWFHSLSHRDPCMTDHISLRFPLGGLSPSIFLLVLSCGWGYPISPLHVLP